MRDYDVRRALHSLELLVHRDEPDTMVIDELGLAHGKAIIDVAVINGQINGYEIKSERDTLVRLPRQEPIYSSVLDMATLVVAEVHLQHARTIVPEWWGLKIARQAGPGEIGFDDARKGCENPKPVADEIVKLLWRDEAMAFLASIGEEKGLRGKSRFDMYDRICKLLPVGEVRALARSVLKSRSDWRPDAMRT